MTTFQNMRVGMRLALAFGALVTFLLGIAAIGLTHLDALNRNFNEIVLDRHNKTALMHEVSDEMNQIIRSVQAVIVVDSKDEAAREISQVDTSKKKLADMLQRLDTVFMNAPSEEQTLLQQLHDRNSAYLVSLIKFTRMLDAGKGEEARSHLNIHLRLELESTFRAIQEFSRFETEMMAKSRGDMAASYRYTRNLMVGLACLAVALSILIAIWIARGVSVPLNEAVAVATRVAGGNLTSKIGQRGQDETGRLLAALSRMNEGLAGIVVNVRTGSGAIALTAGQLLEGNNDLSRRTEKQASSLEETASSMQQFTATVRQNADSAKQASQLAVNASNIATAGGKVVGQVVETMGWINASSKKIVDITGIIDALAFQTNILALNAAVESARAGEHGRGFAVVAAEVRILAQRSADAAKEIKALIATSVMKIDDGTKLVDEAGRTMREIQGSITRVSQLMGDISAASQEQSSEIGQVNEALIQMERVTQQNAALVEEAAAAVELLEQQARGLVETVGVFRLKASESDTRDKPVDVHETETSATGARELERSHAPARTSKRATSAFLKRNASG